MPLMQSLHVHVTEQLSESSVLSTRAAAGRDWVRGWDDNWRWASGVHGIEGVHACVSATIAGDQSCTPGVRFNTHHGVL